MVSIRLLLANGTIITANANRNTDIFWAVRGAGHNFGIALEATFQVHPQQNDGKHYVVDFEFALGSVEDVFQAMNDISDPMPKELAVFVIGRKRGANGVVSYSWLLIPRELNPKCKLNIRTLTYLKPTININLVWSGPAIGAKAYIDRFADLSPVWRDEKVTTWDALPWATYNGLNNILCTPQGWARFPIKNFYAANVKKYDVPTMRAFFDSWRDMNVKYDGSAMVSVMFESFPQQGVRSNALDTAFPWRHEADHFL